MLTSACAISFDSWIHYILTHCKLYLADTPDARIEAIDKVAVSTFTGSLYNEPARLLPTHYAFVEIKEDDFNLPGPAVEKWEPYICFARQRVLECQKSGERSSENWSLLLDALSALETGMGLFDEKQSLSISRSKGAKLGYDITLEPYKQRTLELVKEKQFKTWKSATNYIADRLPEKKGGGHFQPRTVDGWLKEVSWEPQK